jgi:hypothetical protein
MNDASQNPTRWLLAILIGLLAVSVATASAADGVRFSTVSDLAFEDSDDKIVTAMGIRFELDGGLNLVLTNKGKGLLGDVVVPSFDVDGLPKNALDQYDLHAAATGIGVVRSYPGGVLFVLKETHTQRAMATLMEQLAAAGAQIGHLEANGRAFGFTAAGVAYRAVLGASGSGTLVYLGN